MEKVAWVLPVQMCLSTVTLAWLELEFEVFASSTGTDGQ